MNDSLTTSAFINGEDFNDIEVTFYSEPADPQSGYFTALLEVESITVNSIDITSLVSSMQKESFCDELRNSGVA